MTGGERRYDGEGCRMSGESETESLVGFRGMIVGWYQSASARSAHNGFCSSINLIFQPRCHSFKHFSLQIAS